MTVPLARSGGAFLLLSLLVVSLIVGFFMARMWRVYYGQTAVNSSVLNGQKSSMSDQGAAVTLQESSVSSQGVVDRVRSDVRDAEQLMERRQKEIEDHALGL